MDGAALLNHKDEAEIVPRVVGLHPYSNSDRWQHHLTRFNTNKITHTLKKFISEFRSVAGMGMALCWSILDTDMIRPTPYKSPTRVPAKHSTIEAIDTSLMWWQALRPPPPKKKKHIEKHLVS